jgi:hypothetical protein
LRVRRRAPKLLFPQDSVKRLFFYCTWYLKSAGQVFRPARRLICPWLIT